MEQLSTEYFYSKLKDQVKGSARFYIKVQSKKTTVLYAKLAVEVVPTLNMT